jgi:hypothetical protein
MKRASPFVLALIFVIVVATIAWAVLKGDDNGERELRPTPAPGAYLPSPQLPSGLSHDAREWRV